MIYTKTFGSSETAVTPLKVGDLTGNLAENKEQNGRGQCRVFRDDTECPTSDTKQTCVLGLISCKASINSNLIAPKLPSDRGLSWGVSAVSDNSTLLM